jgi:hypothetical protein
MERQERMYKTRKAVAIIIGATIASTPILASAARTDLQSCATAEASPGNMNRGEDKPCGADWANGWPWNPSGRNQCATASVLVPAGYSIVGKSRGIANNPAGVGMDYAMWLDSINVAQAADGGFQVSTQLKNWATFPRIICLTVTVDTP